MKFKIIQKIKHILKNKRIGKLKKFFRFAFLFILISFLLSSIFFNSKNTKNTAFEESNIIKDSSIIIKIKSDTPYMLVNNANIKMDPENLIEPFFFNNEMLIPPFVLVELLGGKVYYDKPSKKITIELENNKIKYFINDRNAIINGENHFLQIAPFANEQEVLVPLTPIVKNYNTVLQPQDRSLTIIIDHLPSGMKNFVNLLEKSYRLNNLTELPSLFSVLTEVF